MQDPGSARQAIELTWVVDGVSHADRRQLVLPVTSTIFAGRYEVIIRYGGTVDYRPTSQANEAETYGRQDTGNGSGQGWDELRSARKWQSGPLPSQAKPEHRWRTRPDPFDGVWEDEIEPLLRNDPTGKLKATTIIDWLGEQYPGRFSASQLRTLQRRLQDWRALHGPEREVYFPQVHPRVEKPSSTSPTAGNSG